MDGHLKFIRKRQQSEFKLIKKNNVKSKRSYKFYY